MKLKLHIVFCITLLCAFVTSCTKNQKDAPNPKIGISDYSYTQFSPPEPMIDISVESGVGENPGGYNFFTLGNTRVPGGNKIYSFNPYVVPSTNYNTVYPDQGRWTVVAGPNGGGAIKIIGGSSSAQPHYRYAVTDQNELWVANGYNSTAWTKTAYQAVDVVGGGQYVYFLGTANMYGGHPIYRLDGGTATEVFPGAAGVKVAVDGNGRPWIVNSLNQIFVGPAPGQNGGFRQVQGGATDISCGGDDIYITGSNTTYGGYQLFKSQLYTETFQVFDGGATRISCLWGPAGYSGGRPMVVNTAGEVFIGNN